MLFHVCQLCISINGSAGRDAAAGSESFQVTPISPIVKINLLKSYCLSLYGCGLWDLQHRGIENVCLSWRAGLRRTWGLPRNCRSVVVDILSNTISLYDVDGLWATKNEGVMLSVRAISFQVFAPT